MELVFGTEFSGNTAQLVGYAALALAITGFLIKSKLGFLIARGGADFTFAVHYILIGAHIAGLLSLVISAVFFIRLLASKSRWQWPLMGSMFIMGIILSAYSYQQPMDWLAIVGTIACLITPTIRSNLAMRLWCFIVVTPLWLVYAQLAGSVPGVLANSLYLVTLGIGIGRLMLTERKSQLLCVAEAAKSD